MFDHTFIFASLPFVVLVILRVHYLHVVQGPPGKQPWAEIKVNNNKMRFFFDVDLISID